MAVARWCGDRQFNSPREQMRAEDEWIESARRMLLADDRFEDKLYTWACTMNSLSQKGFISYRMEHMPLYPERVKSQKEW